MIGVTDTGLVKAKPTDSSTPKAKKKDQGVRAYTDHIEDSTTIAIPTNNTNLVPNLATK
jgi:hypothetical protein